MFSFCRHFSNVFFLPSHLLVPPASFQLLHVSHPSIFSLVVLFSSFYLRMPANIILFSSPSDRITCPKNPSFLLSAVCCSVSSSSIPISMRTLSLVFFSVHDILCIFLHIHISHALIFFHFLCHCPRLTAIQDCRKKSLWYELFIKLIGLQLKIFTLCQILGIGTRQKRPKILSTRQNLVLGSALKFGGLCPEGRRFESHFSLHVGTLGKSFTHSCL